MKSVFILLAVAFLAALVFMGLFMPGAEPKGAEEKAGKQGDVMKLNGIRLTQKKSNAKEMDLWAETAVIALDESRIDLEKFTIVSYSKEAGEVTLSAQKGVLINATNDITASGGTLVRDNTGRALMTDSFTWKNSAREIRTDDPVRVFGEGFTLRGKGLIARLDDEMVEILSGVNVAILPVKK
ncbi:MAG: LPS export ABC transporter periplasmic protein LptC [Nitrospinae bacterium]|nr:LPS export ABC transporter periplasmic protein LptC [Nitrospinota bacterium]